METLRIARATATLLGIGLAGTAFAQIPYPNAGTPNPVTYSFTAAATGDVIGYFGGSGAGYTEEVGLLDNGVLTPAGLGLNDHTSAVGQMFDFGSVTAGDTLIFEDYVFDNAAAVYSVPSMNVAYDSLDGGGSVANHNHVYSVAASANEVYAGSPAGTYVAFEDLAFPNSDYNYFDDTFVFTNVATQRSVPDDSPTILLVALALVALMAARLGLRPAQAR
jgi:hypothetical protein